jgi:hypothetical protein
MAEGDGHVYQGFKTNVMGGLFDLDTDTIKCALVSGHTLDEDAHHKWADVSADEITDGSYAQQTLASLSVTDDGTGTGTACKGKWDAGNVTFNSLTGTDPNYAILYNDSITTPTAMVDGLIVAFELTTATNGGNYTLSWNANGIIRIA